MSNELHFGVAVGIDYYPEFTLLHSARRDAEMFATWLTSTAGGNVPTKNVTVIKHPDYKKDKEPSREKARPTRTMVYDQMQNYWEIADKAVKEDPDNWYKTRMYVYVSGHGIGTGPQDAALFMANAGRRNYGENVSCQALIDFFGLSQYFHDVIIFADCCRDRGIEAELGRPKWTRDENDYGQPRTLLAVAAEFGGKAYEGVSSKNDNPDDYRSYFTKALIEGLKGGVLADEIDEKNLAEYVNSRLGQLLEGTGKTQVAKFFGEHIDRIVFRKKSAVEIAKNSVTVIIRFESAYNGEVVLKNGDNKEVDRQSIDAENREWRVTIAKGAARVIPSAGPEDLFKNGGGFWALKGDQRVIL